MKETSSNTLYREQHSITTVTTACFVQWRRRIPGHHFCPMRSIPSQLSRIHESIVCVVQHNHHLTVSSRQSSGGEPNRQIDTFDPIHIDTNSAWIEEYPSLSRPIPALLSIYFIPQINFALPLATSRCLPASTPLSGWRHADYFKTP